MKYELLKKLVNAYGISGHEQQISQIIKNDLKKVGIEVKQDKLGSLITQIGNSGPKIMLAAHLDEVGFVVKYIDDDGFIFFQPVGGWWNQVMLAQQVAIITNQQQIYYGVIGSKPPHVLSAEARKNPVEISDMFIDIGVKDKQAVIDLGIQIGDMICPVGPYQELADPNYIMAKAFDNRVGCYIISELMQRLKQVEEQLQVQVYGVYTVQEEIGLRGAGTSANMINPDIAIAVDTGIAGDTPKMTTNESMSKLGDGPQIMVLDATTFGHVGLREYMLKIAQEQNIKYQLDFTPGGGTDAGKMHLAHDGALAMSTSVATRYIHSHLSVLHKEDIDALIDLLYYFCLTLDEEKYIKMKG